jgi:hypothetical protein
MAVPGMENGTMASEMRAPDQHQISCLTPFYPLFCAFLREIASPDHRLTAPDAVEFGRCESLTTGKVSFKY